MEFDPVDAITWYVAFVISVTLHEAAHALASYLGGDRTAYEGGQVSLDPIPHMRREPFGMVIMPLLSVFSMGWPMGWASTPYDPDWERRYPRRAAWMAAAGPGANLLLALLALLGLWVGLGMGAFQAPPTISALGNLVEGSSPFLQNVGAFLSKLLVLNALLCLFNLIPLPPLDGASVIGLFLSEDLALRLKQTMRGGMSMLGLLLAWYLFAEIVLPLWSLLIWLVHPFSNHG
jgi:Zn-dependent protease